MPKISKIQAEKGRKRANVVIDGSQVLTLDKNVIIESALQPGQELTKLQIKRLKSLDILHRCIDSAINFISFRPRSETEVRKRLKQRGFDAKTVELAVAQLKKKNLVNDLEFAEYWRNNRMSFNPKSRIMLKQELRQKGVDVELAEEVTVQVDDESAAYNAVKKKLRLWLKLDYDEFHNKLLNFLKWRGFNYEIINRVCRRLWNENHT